MIRKTKRIFFPGLTLIFFSYFSALFSVGVLIGFIVSAIIIEAVRKEKINRIFIHFKNWKIHLHHWMIGSLLLIIIFLGGWFSVLPIIIIGIICGLIIHEFYFDNEWAEVFIKKS